VIAYKFFGFVLLNAILINVDERILKEGAKLRSINSSKAISIICYSISVFIFLAIGLYGVFLPLGKEMGYCVLNFYMIMPVTTLTAALIISMKRGYLFWIYPIVVGLLGMLIPFLVFGTFDVISLFFAFFPALVGFSIGLIIRFIKPKSLKLN
jgi:hypothetical protein